MTIYTDVDSPFFLFLSPFILIGLAIWFIYSFKKYFVFLKYNRMIKNTPYISLESAPQGLVKVRGIIEPFDINNPLKSPLTHKKCCWYNYEITLCKNDNEKLIEEGISCSLFRLRNKNKSCLVYPVNGHIELKTKGYWSAKGFNSATFNGTEELMTRIRALVKEKKPLFRLSERRLEIGQEVTVLGFLKSCDLYDNNMLSEYILKKERDNFLISKSKKHLKNKFFKVSTNHNHPIEQWQQLDFKERKINLISCIGLAGRPFIISNNTSQNLIKELFSGAISYIIQIFISAAAAIWTWFQAMEVYNTLYS